MILYIRTRLQARLVYMVTNRAKHHICNFNRARVRIVYLQNETYSDYLRNYGLQNPKVCSLQQLSVETNEKLNWD